MRPPGLQGPLRPPALQQATRSPADPLPLAASASAVQPNCCMLTVFGGPQDVHVVAAMGLPGGGRTFVTSRYLRHFHTLAVPEASPGAACAARTGAFSIYCL